MGINVLLCLHVGWRTYDAFEREGQKNVRITTLKEKTEGNHAPAIKTTVMQPPG